MASGIYKIVNKLNNKYYIGCSLDIYKRFEQHINELKRKVHKSIAFQRAFDKYGESNFYLKIVKYKKAKKLKELFEIEQRYLDKAFATKMNYNMSKVAAGGDLISHHPDRENIVRRISEGGKKRFKRKGELKKVSKRTKGKNNGRWKGGRCSKKETRVCSHCREKYRIIINRKNKTCSRSCATSLRNIERYKHTKDKGELLHLNCKYCKKNFKWFRDIGKKRIREFCSRTCSNYYMWKNK